jgi:acetyl esterase/lipase
MDRRTVIGLGAGALASLSTRALAADAPAALPTDPAEIIALWPGAPPGGVGVALELSVVERSKTPSLFHDRFAVHVAEPILTVFRPREPDGSAVVIAPGGGYTHVVFDGEGFEPARRLNEAGVTVFVLCYRLPAEGWADASDVPLQDAQRAIRIVRAGAQRFGIDPARTGILGFSAGGHLAASLATRFGESVYAPVDDADALDAKPAFAGLMYPVITMSEFAHKGSRENLIGKTPSDAAIAKYSCEKTVTADTSPCFIAFAVDDDAVAPMGNGMAMFAALRQANVPAEMHAFEIGGHGFGIRRASGKPVSAWPELFLHWGYSHGWFRDPGAMIGA